MIRDAPARSAFIPNQCHGNRTEIARVAQASHGNRTSVARGSHEHRTSIARKSHGDRVIRGRIARTPTRMAPANGGQTE